MPSPVKYSITVSIESQTLDVIRDDPDKVLVLVRDIGAGDSTKDGNIVFAAFPSVELSTTQTFTWAEEYKLEETQTKFGDGKDISSGTERVDILRGQTVTFDDGSHGTVTGQSDSSGNLTVVNDWKNDVCIVVSCKSVNADGVEEVTPHYISAPRVLGDTSVLTPVQSFSVLVRSSIKTKTMIDVTQGVTGHFEINLGQTECEVHYDTFTSNSKDDQWTSISNATKLN